MEIYSMFLQLRFMYLGEVEIGYEEVASFLQVSLRITMKSGQKFK